VDKLVDGASLVLGWVVVELDRLDAFLRFFSRILTSALLSADRSFFSSSESSASSSDSYSSTAVQPAGLLSAKRINLLRLVMRVFTLSSSELAAERFPFEMVLIAPSIASSRELLNSHCTLFPLKLKELEALDSVFSFFGWN